MYIALTAYRDARVNSRLQQMSLDASRASLEAVVQRASEQQTLLEQTLEMSKTQLAVVQEQWNREKERQERRAEIKMVALNDTAWDEIQQSNGRFGLARSASGWLTLRFVFRNVGTIPLVQPVYMFEATPDTVRLNEFGVRTERPDQSRLQVSPSNVRDALPHSQTSTDYIIIVDAFIPAGLPEFGLAFKLIGENMDGLRQFTVNFDVGS
jgi:hypothetical protein